MRDKLLAIIQDACGDENLGFDTRLENLDLDSIEYLEMLHQCEQEFDVRIEDRAIGFLETVEQLAQYIQNRLVIDDHISG